MQRAVLDGGGLAQNDTSMKGPPVLRELAVAPPCWEAPLLWRMAS